MPTVNFFSNKIATEVIDENFDPICPLKPRNRPEVYVPAEKVKEKIPWTFPISLFKDYKPDTEVYDLNLSFSQIYSTFHIGSPEEML